MLISNYESCPHRLPGMPNIGCEPGCSLTPSETPCEGPTYESCPRYKPITSALCPHCGNTLFKDEADWSIVCPSCDAEYFVSAIAPGLPLEQALNQVATG